MISSISRTKSVSRIGENTIFCLSKKFKSFISEGKEAHNFSFKTVINAIYPEDRRMVYNSLCEALKTNDFEEPLTFRLNKPTAKKVVVYLSCSEFNAQRFVLIEDFFTDNTFDESISRLEFAEKFFNSRKSTEEKVYDKIANHAAIGWYVHDKIDNAITLQSNLNKLLHLQEDEVFSIDWLKSHALSAHSSRLENKISKATPEKPHISQHVQFLINGTTYWYDLQIECVFRGGVLIKTIGLFHDITFLKESELLLKKTKEISGLGWHEIDYTTGQVWGDTRFYEIMGYGPKELNTLDQIRAIVAPGEREKITKVLNSDDCSFNVSFKIYDKKGESRYIQVVGEVDRDSNGVPCYFLGCVLDFTKVRQLEDKLNRIQVYSKVGWVDLDMSTGEYYGSDQFWEIFDLEDSSTVNALSDLNEYVIAEDKVVLDHLEQLYANPEVTEWKDIQYRIMTSTGRLKYLTSHGEIIRDVSGIPTKTLVTVQDVTEYRVMEDNLLRAQKISNTGWFEYDVLHPEASKFSEQWIKMHDYQTDEIPTFENYISRLFPEDSELFEHGLVNFLISMPESWDRIDYRIRTRREKKKYISNSSRVIYNDGCPVKVFGVTTDVTSMRTAQIELYKSEELHRLISETSRDVIVLLSGNHRERTVNYISESNASLLGYTAQELKGVLAINLIHPEDRLRYEKVYMDYLQKEDESLKIEIRLKKHDETYIWTEIIANEIEIRQEKYLRLSIRDITERRNNMEALIRANNELNAMITIKSNLVFAFDELGRFERVLGKDELLHMPKEKFIGHPVEQIWTDHNGQHMSKMVRESLKNGSSQVFDCRHGKNGTVGRWFRVSTHPYVSMGSKNKVCVVIEDITERNKFEQAIINSNSELKALIKATDNLIFGFDKQGKFERVIGDPLKLHMPAESFVGLQVEAVWNDRNGVKMAQMVRRSLQSGEEEMFSCVVENELGEKEYHKVTTHPYRGLDNQLKVCVIKEDVTLQRKYEEELKGMLDKERELSKMRASFVAMASHQFRTPLTVIKSNMQLIKAYGVENKLVNRVSERLTREVDRLVGLMEDVLTLGKVQSDQFTSNPTSFCLLDLIQDVVGDVVYCDVEGRILSVNHIGAPKKVEADYDMLRHAFINLVDNAFKYSQGARAPEVHVDYSIDNEVELAIQDYGIGIPKEDIGRIFQDFYRSPNVKEIQGTGLGMSITKEFLTINKCKLKVESVVGEGSVFTIRIPMAMN